MATIPKIEVDSSLAVGISAKVVLFGRGAHDKNARFIIQFDEDVDLWPTLIPRVRVLTASPGTGTNEKCREHDPVEV